MLLQKLEMADYEAMLKLYQKLDELHAAACPDLCKCRVGEEAFPRKAMENNLKCPECLMLGAFDAKGKMIGTVRASLWEKSGMVDNLKNVCLDDIYVLPEYRKCGIARQMFQAVEQWAREQGALRLDLHVFSFNQGAIAMYEAMGMQPREYIMEKAL